MRKNKKPNLSALADNWPLPYVPRKDIEKFTGGIMTSKYICSLDSQGIGPKERIKMGGKVAYPIEALIQWLESRSMEVRS